MNQNTNIRWTAIFIVSTGDQDKYFQSDACDLFSELLSARLAQHVKIVLCLSTPLANLSKIDEGGFDIKDAGPDDIVTVVYKIERDVVTLQNKLVFLNRLHDFKMQDQGDIACFLRIATQPEFQADRYMLFTWDHGAPYGIFEIKDDEN